MLVRPDGYVGARFKSAPEDPEGALHEALRHPLEVGSGSGGLAGGISDRSGQGASHDCDSLRVPPTVVSLE